MREWGSLPRRRQESEKTQKEFVPESSSSFIYTHNTSLSPPINESNHVHSRHRSMCVDSGPYLRRYGNLLRQSAPRALLSAHKICHLKRDPEAARFDNKNLKAALWLFLPFWFHSARSHSAENLSPVRPIRIVNPRLQGQANLLLLEATRQTLNFPPRTDLASVSPLYRLFLFHREILSPLPSFYPRLSCSFRL